MHDLGQLFLHCVVNWLPSSQNLRIDWATYLQRWYKKRTFKKPK